MVCFKDVAPVFLSALPGLVEQNAMSLETACRLAGRMGMSGALGTLSTHQKTLSDVYVAIFNVIPRGSCEPLAPLCTLTRTTIATLKEALARAKLPVTGRKDELIRRLPRLPPPDLVGVVRAGRIARIERQRLFQTPAGRRRLLTEALAAHGLPLRADSRLCDSFIRYGGISLAEVVRIMREMKFYFEHTDYSDYYERVRNVFLKMDGRADPEEISDEAKDFALERLVERLGTDAVLSNPDLPPSLRDKVQRRYPRGLPAAEPGTYVDRSLYGDVSSDDDYGYSSEHELAGF
jgi:hypothetical protein